MGSAALVVGRDARIAETRQGHKRDVRFRPVADISGCAILGSEMKRRSIVALVALGGAPILAGGYYLAQRSGSTSQQMVIEQAKASSF